MVVTKQKVKSDKPILIGLMINSLYAVVEFIFGLITGSLALVADATHNFTDSLTLLVSYIASKIGRRSANQSKTFGYGRATILSALFNASFMMAVSGLIILESLKRLNNPVEIHGGVVAVVALLGIFINGAIAFLLSKQKKDLNFRVAYVDMLFDALASFGALLSGVIIYFTGVKYIDSLVGILIAILLIHNTIKILKEAFQVLLEGSPIDVDVAVIAEVIKNQQGVNEVDDIHIWSIKSGYNALSCHIVIDESNLTSSRKVVDNIKSLLAKKHNIQHSTIEVELEDCQPTHKYL